MAAKMLSWLRKKICCLCCGSKGIRKEELEEISYKEGSLPSLDEFSLEIGERSKDEASKECPEEIPEKNPEPVVDESVKTPCEDNTATCDDVSTVSKVYTTINLDATTFCVNADMRGSCTNVSAADEITVSDDVSTIEEHSASGDGYSTKCEERFIPWDILDSDSITSSEMEDIPLETTVMTAKDRVDHPMKINYRRLKYNEVLDEFAPVRPDVFVCTEGKEYLVHSEVLTYYSTFFQHRLNGREGLDSVIFLPSECVSSEALETLLRFMYYGVLLFSNCRKIEAVIKATQYLGVGAVEELCLQIQPETFNYHSK